jgi:hypothetical protein
LIPVLDQSTKSEDFVSAVDWISAMGQKKRTLETIRAFLQVFRLYEDFPGLDVRCLSEISRIVKELGILKKMENGTPFSAFDVSLAFKH